MTKRITLLFFVALCAFAQSDNLLSSAIKMQYGIAKNDLLKAAEKMPEDAYAFKATDQVRSFGQIVGHVANANYSFCSAALGEKSPANGNIEKTKTTKADLKAALEESFAFCDKAYDAMTDATAVQKVTFGKTEMARGGVLTFNNMHDMEHYGNIVTYMRLKNIVPPSSEPRK